MLHMHCSQDGSLAAQGRSQLCNKYLKWVHVGIAGPMHVPSAGGGLYLYVAVDDHTRAVYTWLLFLKSEVPDVFKAFRAAAENKSGKRLHKVMIDNACKLSMGKIHDICDHDGIKLHTMVPISSCIEWSS